MVSVKAIIAAGTATLISSAAFAADLRMPPPPQYQPPVAVAESSGWYLRGDVGVGVQTFNQFDLGPPSGVPATWAVNQTNIQDATIAGFGVGYELNNWLRFDVTGEYRTKAAFKVTGSYTDFCPATAFGPGTCFDVNSGNFSSSVFLANAYVDLGTWWCL